jgi:hypothetical protein
MMCENMKHRAGEGGKEVWERERVESGEERKIRMGKWKGRAENEKKWEKGRVGKGAR